jgi:DNA-directed RNA polymerase specialized sigma24 family protein
MTGLPRTSNSYTDRGYAKASEEELLVRYRDRKDAGVFETLVRRYEKLIYNYLLRYLRNGPWAEEVFQATLLRLHEKRHLFN